MTPLLLSSMTWAFVLLLILGVCRAAQSGDRDGPPTTCPPNGTAPEPHTAIARDERARAAGHEWGVGRRMAVDKRSISEKCG